MPNNNLHRPIPHPLFMWEYGRELVIKQIKRLETELIVAKENLEIHEQVIEELKKAIESKFTNGTFETQLSKKDGK